MPLACTEPDVKSGMVLLVLYCFHFGGYPVAGRLQMRCRGSVGQGHCNFQPRRRQGVDVTWSYTEEGRVS